MVAVDPGVANSQYAIRIGNNNKIELGGIVGGVTTTDYVAGIGVLNPYYSINGLYAGTGNVVIASGEQGWSFNDDGTITFPLNGELDFENQFRIKDTATNKTWYFQYTGELNIPGGIGGLGDNLYFGPNQGGATVYIPHAELVNLPVGFEVKIVNRTGGNIYIYCDSYMGYFVTGEIYGDDHDDDSYGWYCYDQGSGIVMTLLKIEDYFPNQYQGHPDRWMLSGPNWNNNWGVD